jgi:uncharacterized protein YllA (UPF0747 family)
MILGRMPVPLPRLSFTLLDERSHKLLNRYGLLLSDFFHGQEGLRERISARLVPPALSDTMRQTARSVEDALQRLKREMAEFDPTLRHGLEKSERKIRYQLDKIERKAGLEALRRDARAERDAASLYGLIYPERHLQERLYSILPFLAKHGPDLVGRLYDSLVLDCPDHRLVVV